MCTHNLVIEDLRYDMAILLSTTLQCFYEKFCNSFEDPGEYCQRTWLSCNAKAMSRKCTTQLWGLCSENFNPPLFSRNGCSLKGHSVPFRLHFHCLVLFSCLCLHSSPSFVLNLSQIAQFSEVMCMHFNIKTNAMNVNVGHFGRRVQVICCSPIYPYSNEKKPSWQWRGNSVQINQT